MRRSAIRCRLSIPMLVLLAAPAAGQIPDSFTNLKVLPADIEKRALIDEMRGFVRALGVRCNHCHLGEDPNSLAGYDFASDEKESKRVARAMMKMTREINGTLLPATGREDLIEVSCWTCHHGVTEPRPLEDVLQAIVHEKGVEAAIDRYRELHGEYRERGVYDFHPRVLNRLANRLAAEEKVEEAIAIVRLNLEGDPDNGFTHHALGELQLQAGDREGALASFRKALEIHPDNPRAKERIEMLQDGGGPAKTDG